MQSTAYNVKSNKQGLSSSFRLRPGRGTQPSPRPLIS